MTHTIRLRGPWHCQPLERAGEGPLPAAGTLAMPGDWSELLGADFRGRARLTRLFNRPTGLDELHRVWLVLDDAGHVSTLHLNGQELSRGLPRQDITALLNPRNELIIEIISLDAPGALGLVQLEIEEPASDK
ncbi:MAG: hypothetical protein SFU86_21940 [Pirellulaceae bacterium]|nr:hypothetical protein [Pirellulaceae bacterium]